jgi:hypothetical protein
MNSPTAARQRADKAEFGGATTTQRRDFFEGRALKLRKGFTDKPSNGKEQSDPGSGVRGRSFVGREPQAKTEEDERRAQQAGG